MLSPIELKKLQVEYHKVMAARMDLELRQDEYKESIKKLQENIDAQVAREQDLIEKIKQAQS